MPHTGARSLGWLGILIVKAYQLLLSPFAGGACRFEPSCSAYAIGAFESHGLLRGGWLTFRRITKCHPFGPHGLDPVPGDHPSSRS